MFYWKNLTFFFTLVADQMINSHWRFSNYGTETAGGTFFKWYFCKLKHLFSDLVILLRSSLDKTEYQTL